MVYIVFCIHRSSMCSIFKVVEEVLGNYEVLLTTNALKYYPTTVYWKLQIT